MECSHHPARGHRQAAGIPGGHRELPGTSATDLNRMIPSLTVSCAPQEGERPAHYEHHRWHDLAILGAGCCPIVTGYCPNRGILESQRTATDIWT